MVDYVGDEKPNVKDGTPSLDTMAGDAGNDTLRGLGSFDTLLGEEGDDKLFGGGGADGLFGGTGKDLLLGDTGKDTLSGGDGNDRIYGGGGDDVIQGDPGHDKLWGDTGDDAFLYPESEFGKDTIKDFKAGEGTPDAIGFGFQIFNGFQKIMAATKNFDGSAVIRIGEDGVFGSVTIEGVLKRELHQDDFFKM